MFSSWRRKKYFIYPSFQWVLILTNLVGVIFSFVIFATLLAVGFSRMIEIGKQSGFPETHPYFGFLAYQSGIALKGGLLAALFAGTLNTLFFIWFSHRLVGPIHGLRLYLNRYIEAQKEGRKIEPVQFRKNDFFGDIANLINEVLGSSKN